MTGQQRRLLARARTQIAELAATVEKLGILLELDDGPPLPRAPRGASGRWTDEHVSTMREMLDAGAHHEQIAQALGRTVSSVAKRASRYGLKRAKVSVP